MNMRAEILSKIKEAAGSDASLKDRRNAVEERLGTGGSGPRPPGGGSSKEMLELFREKLAASSATLDECKAADVHDAVTRFIRQNNLPADCRIGTDERLAGLIDSAKGMLEIKTGPSDGNDLTTISHAVAAFAETATLVLESGPENPTTLNFLAENHIVVLSRKDLKVSQEEIWAMLRKKHGSGQLPRTINLVTGPSRSADIEQTLILGAHGPIRLHVILVEDR